jgi:hypothetical protein
MATEAPRRKRRAESERPSPRRPLAAFSLQGRDRPERMRLRHTEVTPRVVECISLRAVGGWRLMSAGCISSRSNTAGC